MVKMKLASIAIPIEIASAIGTFSTIGATCL